MPTEVLEGGGMLDGGCWMLDAIGQLEARRDWTVEVDIGHRTEPGPDRNWKLDGTGKRDRTGQDTGARY